jgi:hypothetical protein
MCFEYDMPIFGGFVKGLLVKAVAVEVVVLDSLPLKEEGASGF